MDVVLAMTVLITGLVVVFCVLILLTFIIKGYSTLIYNAQNKKKGNKGSGSKKMEQKKEAPKPQVTKAVTQSPSAPVKAETGIPGEIIAAISAAIAVMNDGTGTSYTIKSVKRAAGSRPVWGTAGLMENTRPF